MANGLTWWFLSMWLFVAWWFLSIHMINFKHSNVVFWTPEWWVFSMWLFVTWWKINMHMIKNHHTYDEKSTSTWWKIINLFVFTVPHINQIIFCQFVSDLLYVWYFLFWLVLMIQNRNKHWTGFYLIWFIYYIYELLIYN